MGGERQAAEDHDVISVHMITSQGAVGAWMQKGVDGQWVLLRSFQFYFRMIKTVGGKNKKLSETHSGPEPVWV